MKCLSIRQPWAWIICAGIKDVENRVWPTQFRGEFLVHAGKTIDRDGIEYLKDMGFRVPDPLPTCGIVGIATIIDCVESSRSKWFGGPFGFVIKDAYPVKFAPLPGMLRFFEVDMKPVRQPRPTAASLTCPKGKRGGL